MPPERPFDRPRSVAPGTEAKPAPATFDIAGRSSRATNRTQSPCCGGSTSYRAAGPVNLRPGSRPALPVVYSWVRRSPTSSMPTAAPRPRRARPPAPVPGALLPFPALPRRPSGELPPGSPRLPAAKMPRADVQALPRGLRRGPRPQARARRLTLLPHPTHARANACGSRPHRAQTAASNRARGRLRISASLTRALRRFSSLAPRQPGG